MSIENLSNEKAITKIKDLIKTESTCIFTTALTELPLAAAPMNTIQVDDDGSLWFFSSKYSDRNQHIEKDSRVQLFFSNTSDYEFLSIYGKAEILFDKTKAKEMWMPIVKTWFHEGVDDPAMSIIKVTPEDAYYWDTKSNKLVALLKMTAGMLLGKTMDDSLEGRLTV